MAGGYLSVFRGSGIEFDEVREYAEGDPQRAVDWNVTARMGRPFVKTYVDERELTVLFLARPLGVDGRRLRRLVRAADGGAGVRLPGALRGPERRQGRARRRSPTRSTPTCRRARERARAADRARLPRAPGAERGDLAPRRRSSSPRARCRGTPSSSWSPTSSAEGWEQALTLCARRHDVIAVRLLAPELDPAITGLVRLRDPESGATVVVDGSSPRGRAGLPAAGRRVAGSGPSRDSSVRAWTAWTFRSRGSRARTSCPGRS